MPTRCTSCGDMDYSDLGDMPCWCRFQAGDQYGPKPPGPTIEDLCEPHPFHCCKSDPRDATDDELATLGTCYCGKVSYPVDRDGELVES